MMKVSQAIALAVAQAQPSASSSPNMARFRGTVRPGCERTLGHRPPSSAAGRPGAPVIHLTVSVPVMLAWTEQ